MKFLIYSVLSTLLISQVLCVAVGKKDDTTKEVGNKFKLPVESNDELHSVTSTVLPKESSLPKKLDENSNLLNASNKESHPTVAIADETTTDPVPIFPPEPLPDTTASTTTTTTTTTPAPTKPTPTTSSTTKSSTSSPTTPPSTTPHTTSVSPPSTTPHTTAAPAPSKKGDRSFDGLSFFAGIVLSAGLLAIGVVAYKFYEARRERNYHTL